MKLGCTCPALATACWGSGTTHPSLEGELDRFPPPRATVSRVSLDLTLLVVSPGPLLSWAHDVVWELQTRPVMGGVPGSALPECR